MLLAHGDAATAHDQMGFFLQGRSVATVTTAKNTFSSGRYCACVANNRIDVLLEDLGGSDANVVLNAVEIVRPPLLDFDFGTAASPVAGGFLQVTNTTTYSAVRGYGWTAGSIASRDRGTGSDLDRDLNFTRDGTFAVDVLPGRYRVTVTLGDAAAAHDLVNVEIEGVWVGQFSTAANQFHTSTHAVAVDDGKLDIRLIDVGGTDANAVITALRVR